MAREWRIGEVAELTGLTRRTLRHYDELGLLVPSARSWGDYRLYAEADLLRLLQIQNLKALGLSLAEIAAALADPALDAGATLGSHLAKLEEQIAAEQSLAERLRRLAGNADRNWRDVLEAIALTQELAHPDPNRRIQAALQPADNSAELFEALRSETDPAVVEFLIWALANRPAVAATAARALQEPDPEFRCRLLRVLSKAADPASIPAIQAQLTDPEPQVVTGAVRALGQLGAVAAANDLVRLFDSPAVPEVEVMQALAAIGPTATPALIAGLTSASAQLRALAAEALGQIAAGSPNLHPPLAAEVAPLLEDPDRSVQVAAAMTLAELGAAGASALQRQQDDPTLARLIERLLAQQQG